MESGLQKILAGCVTALLIAIGGTVWITSNNVTALGKDVDHFGKQLTQAYDASDAQKDLQMRDFHIDNIKDDMSALRADVTAVKSQLTALESLRAEITALKSQQTAFDSQLKLFDTWRATLNSP